MKRKRSKKEISEQSLREAENLPIVRQLRELYARGMAELETERRAERRTRTAEAEGVPIVHQLRELYARGMAELEAERPDERRTGAPPPSPEAG